MRSLVLLGDPPEEREDGTMLEQRDDTSEHAMLRDAGRGTSPPRTFPHKNPITSHAALRFFFSASFLTISSFLRKPHAFLLTLGLNSAQGYPARSWSELTELAICVPLRNYHSLYDTGSLATLRFFSGTRVRWRVIGEIVLEV